MLLIAYDGSDEARRAIWAVARLHKGAPVAVLYVSPPEVAALVPMIGPAVPVPAPEHVTDQAADEAHAREVARAGADLALAAGLDAEPVTAVGAGVVGTAEAIIEVADECRADLIVVAAHARSRVLSVLLGSVTDSVVHRAQRPVLVIPARRR